MFKISMVCMCVVAALALSGGLAIATEKSSDREGKIIGRISSGETGNPLAFADVHLFRTDSLEDTIGVAIGGAVASSDGTYRITVAPGFYRLKVGYIGYKSSMVYGVMVEDGKAVTMDVALATSAAVIEGVEVTARADRATEAALLVKQKRAPVVSDGVGAQQIKKTPDANAAEVLKRVTGLSVVGGRYLYVRGLGERYSATQVNGAVVGTPEPNKRVLPLDIFASGLIENVVVQKTYSPDQPGEFGGGVVNITTREFPGEEVWSVALGSGYGSMTTGKDFLSYTDGGIGFLGVDGGRRGLPGVFESIARGNKIVPRTNFAPGFSPDTIAIFGQSFKDRWGVERRTARANYSFSGTYGNETSLLGQPLGFIGSVSLSNQLTSRSAREWTYEGGEGAVHQEEEIDLSEGSLLWGALLNAGYRLRPEHLASLRLMYNRSAEDQVRVAEGISTDYGRPYRATRMRYVERGLASGTAGMSHRLSALRGLVVDWRYGYSRADRNEPDRRKIVYEYMTDHVMNEDDEVVDTTYAWRLSRSRPYRWFGETSEDDRSFEANAALPFRQWGGLEARMKVGFALRNKDRDSRWRRFAFSPPGGLGSSGDSILALPAEELLAVERIGGSTSRQFVLQEETLNNDAFQAHQDLAAGYLMFDLPLRSTLRAVFGARVERAEVDVLTYDQFRLASEQDKIARRDDTDWLPAVNLTWSPGENTNIRGAWSTTVSRPDLREFSVTRMVDADDENYQLVGNGDLRRAVIRNHDVRFETYPSSSELVAVSVFYKDFEKPIEQAVQIDDQPVYKPINGTSGRLLGAEFEVRLGLDRASKSLAGLGTSANVTLVDSEVNLEESTGAQATNHRPLGGQSPYVVNAGLHWTAKSSETSASLLFNRYGKRLYRVGLENLADIYEQARATLDLTIASRVGGAQFKLSAGNLLDSEVKFDQGSNPTHRSKRGRSVSLTASVGS